LRDTFKGEGGTKKSFSIHLHASENSWFPHTLFTSSERPQIQPVNSPSTFPKTLCCQAQRNYQQHRILPTPAVPNSRGRLGNHSGGSRRRGRTFIISCLCISPEAKMLVTCLISKCCEVVEVSSYILWAQFLTTFRPSVNKATIPRKTKMTMRARTPFSPILTVERELRLWTGAPVIVEKITGSDVLLETFSLCSLTRHNRAEFLFCFAKRGKMMKLCGLSRVSCF